MKDLRPPRPPGGRSRRRAAPALAITALISWVSRPAGTRGRRAGTTQSGRSARPGRRAAAWAAWPAAGIVLALMAASAPAAYAATGTAPPAPSPRSSTPPPAPGSSAPATPPEKAAPAPGTSRLGEPNTSTWMGDEAPNLWYKQLSHILIPGTHDSTTYSIGSPGDYSEAQDQELTQQLNDGIREFDIRVGWVWTAARGWGYYAEHGITYSTWLELPRIFSDIDGWATEPGHDKEVILLNFAINQNGSNFFPAQDCQVFAAALGGSLVTPDELQAHFGTTDMGQVTLGQLWSLPDPKDAARVIINGSPQCMDAVDPNAGSWTGGGGYYANWCGNDDNENGAPGIINLDLGAADAPFRQDGTGDSPSGYAPSVGGLYVIDLQQTPYTNAGCAEPPKKLADSQQAVLNALLAAASDTNAEYPYVGDNLNVIEGDYYETFNLVSDIIEWDESAYPPKTTPPTVNLRDDLTLGDGQASVAFTDADYGNLALTYYVTATDLTDPSTRPVYGIGSSSPVTVPGLTNGHLWSFTVTAVSAEAGRSSPVDAGAGWVGVPPAIVSGPAATGTVGTPYSSGFTVTGAPPPAVTLVSGTPPPGLALASDGTGKLTGTPTQAGSYTFTVKAYNRVDGIDAFNTVTITIAGSAPAAPAITGVTLGDGQAGVAFSDASAGTDPITSYTVSATDKNHPAAPPVTASGPASPVTVKGLTNGDPYLFTVTATSAAGTSPPSGAYGPLNVGVAPVILTGPANGTAGQPYSSAFTVTGAPPPALTQTSGTPPPGLTLASDGTAKLTGTPTQAGSYTFSVQAVNPVGIYDATVTVVIAPATLGAGPPPPGGRQLPATICTTPAGHQPACAVRTLTGTFPPLGTSAAATLLRGTVTYAAGRVTAGYCTLTLSGQRPVPAGSYTLILRHGHHAIIIPVTIR